MSLILERIPWGSKVSPAGDPELAPERSEPISSDPGCGSDRSVISHGRIGSARLVDRDRIEIGSIEKIIGVTP